MGRSLFSIAVVGALHIAVFAAQAASAQSVPTAQQIAPTREEIVRPSQDQAPRPARLKIDGDIERAPCALDAPAYADIKATITTAEFHNLQGVSPEALRASYAALLGADRPISTICAIRDAAATALRQKGYLAAVQVPVQRIESGTVRFEVLYAKIVAIRVRGDAGKAEPLLAHYLSHLTEQKIFNRFEAERYLLLSRDLPGYDVRLTLKPAGTGPGELVGEVSVVHTPLDITANLQNLAAHSSGRWTGAVAAQAYGLLGGDRLSASVSSTADFKEQQVVQLGYDTRLGGEGLIVSGNFTYAWSKPDIGTLSAAPTSVLTARTLFATGEIGYPLIRRQAFSLVGTAGWDYLNQNVRLGGIALTRDHLRVGFLRFDIDAADVSERRAPNWRTSATVEFRRGFDLFDASPHLRAAVTGIVPPSHYFGDSTASLVRASATVELNMGGGFWLAALPRGQYAFDPLLSFEQFSGGNYSIGRGYDPGAITGDSGIGSGFELRFPRMMPLPKTNWVVMPFAFTDIAWAWNKPVNRIGGVRNPDELLSVGFGLRSVLNNRFRLDGTLAIPLEAVGLQTHNNSPRFLISLTTKLWPWGNR